MAPTDIPSFEAEWWPIQWEPIPGSGERLTIAVVTQTKDGAREVRQVIQPSALANIFGGSSAQLLIGSAITSIDRQLKSGVEVRKLLMPFDGLDVAPSRDSRAADLAEVYEQAIALSASFGVSTFGITEQADPEWQQAYRAWTRQIETEAEDSGMPWKTRFNQSVTTSGISSKAVINYLHAGYAANFGVIRPKPAHDKRSLKVKLHDLRSARLENPLAIERCELLIGMPPANMPGMTSRDKKAVADCMEWAIYTGIRDDVNVLRFTSAIEVLEHLKAA